MIVDAGLNQIRNWLHGDSITEPTHMAVGTGTAATKSTDTTLETEVLRETFSAVTKGGDGEEIFEMTLGTTEANGNTLTEVAGFNAASAGDMLFRIVFSGIAKTSSFELKIEVKVKLQRST